MDFEYAWESACVGPHPAPARSFPPCRVRSALVVQRAGGDERARLEEFVRREYYAHFQARLEHFMPLLLALYGCAGVRAVVGCRSAGEEPLFLEQYTREPIEQLLSRRLCADVRREEIAEIGSFACRDARAAVDMVRELVPYLLDAGFSWVVFTGADTIRRVFRHLRLEPTALCAADEDALGEQRDDWGDYYRHHPEVMAGRLRLGAALLGIAPELQS